MEEKEVHVIQYELNKAGSYTTTCPHVKQNMSYEMTPAVGCNNCKKCLFHEGKNYEEKTVKCSCSAYDLDPRALGHTVMPSILEESGMPKGLAELLSGLGSPRARANNPFEKQTPKSKSDEAESLIEMLISLKEAAGGPDMEISDEEIERHSKGLVDTLFPQVLKTMTLMGRMSGKEALKKHENRVYDLLEEKIAARRKELETL